MVLELSTAAVPGLFQIVETRGGRTVGTAGAVVGSQTLIGFKTR
jgi:hypothetical protein